MHYILQLAVNVINTVLFVVLIPLTHMMLPVSRFMWSVFNHTFVIPVLLMVRISLFGLVYLPLAPVLTAVNVKYDTDVPVETALYRLGMAMIPHMRFFLLQLVHYVMVGFFVGCMVGLVTGFNISLVARLMTLSDADNGNEVKRTIGKDKPHTQSAAHAHNHWSDMESSWHKHQVPAPSAVKLSEKNEKTEKKEETIKSEKTDVPFISNIPVKKETHNAVASSETDVYEDDDGYSYMAYDAEILDLLLANIPAGPMKDIFGAMGSVHTIEEGLESEKSASDKSSDLEKYEWKDLEQGDETPASSKDASAPG